jgi:hypothetical protein
MMLLPGRGKPARKDRGIVSLPRTLVVRCSLCSKLAGSIAFPRGRWFGSALGARSGLRLRVTVVGDVCKWGRASGEDSVREQLLFRVQIGLLPPIVFLRVVPYSLQNCQLYRCRKPLRR